jgi:hypothetical protein
MRQRLFRGGRFVWHRYQQPQLQQLQLQQDTRRIAFSTSSTNPRRRPAAAAVSSVSPISRGTTTAAAAYSYYFRPCSFQKKTTTLLLLQPFCTKAGDGIILGNGSSSLLLSRRQRGRNDTTMIQARHRTSSSTEDGDRNGVRMLKVLLAETERFLGQEGEDEEAHDSSSSSSQQAAHLLEQWLNLFDKKNKNDEQYYHLARLIFSKWLASPSLLHGGDAVPLSQYFHRVLSITNAPEAYQLYESYFHSNTKSSAPPSRPPPTSAAICMVVERMLPYQWHDHASTTILSDLERLVQMKTMDDASKRRAQNAVLAHYPHWTADQAMTYLDNNFIIQPDAYSYAAVIQKYIVEDNIDAACALARKVAALTAMAAPETTKTRTAKESNNDEEEEDGTTICTNLCLWALAQRPERTDEVEPLFRTLRRPNAYSYSALLAALSPTQGRNVLLNQTEWRRCNAHSYGIVMAKFAKLPDQGETVEELLHHASRHLPTADLTVIKGMAMMAWGNTNTYGAPDRATAIYQTIESPPSPALTTTLLQGWAKSTRPDAAERCCTIFQTMVNQRTATTAAFHLMLSAQPSDTAWAMVQAQAQVMMTMTNDDAAAAGVVVPIATSWATVLARPGHSVERIYEIVAHYKDAMMNKKKQRDDDAVFVQAVRTMPTVASAHAFVVKECRSKSSSYPPQQFQRKRNYAKVYLALLKRWSHSREAVAPERAEEIALWIAREEEEQQQEPEGTAAGTDTTAEQVRKLLIETWHRSNRAMAPARIGYLERGQQSFLIRA